MTCRLTPTMLMLELESTFLVYKLRNAPPRKCAFPWSIFHLVAAPGSSFNLVSGNPQLIPHHLKAWSRWATTNRISIQASWICEGHAVWVEIPELWFICCVYILMFVFGNFYVFLNISFDMFMQMNTEHTRRCQTKRISGNWHFYVVLLLYVVSYHRSATSRPRSIPKHGFSYVTSTLKLGNCNLVLQS